MYLIQQMIFIQVHILVEKLLIQKITDALQSFKIEH